MRTLIVIAALLCLVPLLIAAADDTDYLVKASITDNKIMVFSKSYCPYCKRAKETLRKHNIDFQVIELDQHAQGAQIQASLQKLTGQRTVPNIFISGRHIGGSDAIVALHESGELAKILQAAGADPERSEL